MACSKCQELIIKLNDATNAKKRAGVRARLRRHCQNKHTNK